MNKIIFVMFVILSLSIKVNCQSNFIDSTTTNFLDSTDIDVIFNKNKLSMFEFIGSPVDSSMQEKKIKYIFNYQVKSKIPITNGKLARLLFPLLTCKAVLPEIPKCTILVKYCVEISSKNAKLYLFFSEIGTCQNIIKVTKINTHNPKEHRSFFDVSAFLAQFPSQ